MKLSCIPICFFDQIIRTRTMSLQEWVAMAVDLKLDGIEMYEPYLTSWKIEDLAALSALVHNSGLAISMFTSYADFAHPGSSEQERVYRAVDAAIVFETQIVRLTAGRWPADIESDQVLENVANGLKRCLDYAEKQGVILALEDHPEIGTKISDFIKILELVDDERLKVNLDTSNPMEAGENAVDLVKLVKNRVVHVHASDRDKDLSHTVVGEGVVDFAGIFKILKNNGYDGWISLEAGGQKGKEGIHQGIEFVKRTWAAV